MSQLINSQDSTSNCNLKLNQRYLVPDPQTTGAKFKIFQGMRVAKIKLYS